jgi:spermidine/putrescine transport system permease protein
VTPSAALPRIHTGVRPAVRAARAAFSAYSVAIYVFLYAPIAVLVLFSFNAATQTAVWSGFTFRWYQELAADEAVWRAAWISAKVAVATTITATALGTAAAIGLRRAPSLVRRIATPLLLLPIILPEIVMAVALLRIFGASGITLDFWTIWFAHVVFCVSYVVIVVRARLAGMDDALEEAAADLGATRWVAFWKVTLPQLWPAVLSASLLVLTLSIDDYVVTSFVSGVGNTTLPLQIYAMFRKHITPEINAICTLLLVGTTSTILLAAVLQRSLQQPRSPRKGGPR